MREIVDRVNKIFGKNVGWQIELRGWEDALPGFKRPQDIINRDVDECELFVGMLWTRWGTPTANYTSGFHEEFERIRTRCQHTKVPAVWLLFRKIDAERLQDPGPQLAQVLEFKQKQQSANEIFFKEYEDIEHFSELFNDLLVEFLLVKSREKATEGSSNITNRPTEAAPSQPATSAEITNPRRTEAGSSLTVLLHRAADSLDSTSGQPDLALPDRTRLLLATTAWFSSQHADETLGIHELHITYRHRLDWDLTATERFILVRTMFADKDEYIPGWCWLAMQNHEHIGQFIRYFATTDAKSAVRAGATNVAARLHISFEAEELQGLLNDSEEEVVLAAIRWVELNGAADQVVLLQPLLSDNRAVIRDRAGSVYFDIRFKQEPASALREYIENGAKPTTWLTNKQIDSTMAMSVEFFKSLLARPEGTIRAFAAEWLRRDNALDGATWEQLLSDPDEGVKDVAVKALIDAGKTFDRASLKKLFKEPRGLLSFALRTFDAEAFRRRELAREPDAALYSRLDFYDLDGPLIYDILAERGFTRIVERLRDDVTSRFATLRQEYESVIRQELGTAADSILARWEPEMIEFVKDRFLIVALPHFAKIATDADRNLIREFCASHTLDVSIRAAAILAKIGDESDVNVLLKLRTKLWGEHLEEIVGGAIEVAADKAALLTMLLQDEKAGNISTLLGRHLLDLPAAGRIPISKAMLQRKVPAVRLEGVRVLSLTMSPSELVDLLNAYVEQDTYYYDVVSWLDKLVYSPEPYHQLYVAELKRLA